MIQEKNWLIASVQIIKNDFLREEEKDYENEQSDGSCSHLCNAAFNNSMWCRQQHDNNWNRK